MGRHDVGTRLINQRAQWRLDEEHETERLETELPDGAQATMVGSPRWTAINWALALTSLLGAAAVVIFAYVQVLGSAGCSPQTCPRLGPGPIGFTLIVWGAPLVSLASIALSPWTARRRAGLLVVSVTWLLLVAAVVVLIVTFP